VSAYVEISIVLANTYRMALYYPLSATLALFANILENPQSNDAFSDIDLMGVVTAFLNQSIQSQQHLGGIVRIFAELNHIAGLVVRDAQMTRLSELKKQIDEAADMVHQDVSSTVSQAQSVRYIASPEGSDDAIPPAVSYPYNAFDPFDQSQLYSMDEPFMNFPYELSDPWTEPTTGNLASEMHMNW
jgi:hypothetical protein